MNLRFLLPLVSALLPIAAAVAAEAPITTQPAADAGYRIGPGDKIAVSVLGLPNFDRETYVSNSGKVHLPRLGVISVIEHSASELSKELEIRYTEKGLLTDPVVRVRVIEYRSKPVYVMGEVLSPGQFVITEKMFLSDLIGIANGLASSAGDVGYLYRRREPNSEPDGLQDPLPADGTVDSIVDDVTVVKLAELYTDPSVNVQLRGGDMFYIPVKETEHIYVIGDVLHPGQHEMPETGSVFGVRALAMAGGPLKTAKLAHAVIVSRNVDGSVSYDKINLKSIFRGRESDVVLEPGQILFVPGSATKALGFGLLGSIPGVALL